MSNAKRDRASSDGEPMPDRERELIEAARRQVSMRPVVSDGGGLIDSDTTTRAGGQIPASVDSIPGYTITREIHRGGQGVVYQAIQKNTHRKVAIKVMHEGPFASSQGKARFDREVQILGQLDHPNIVTIHDSGSVGGNVFYVMDYVSGEPLERFITGELQPIREVLRLFLKICDAVNAAHLRGVIHRDLKPGNIRIHRDGEPRLLDFGLAKVAAGQAVGEGGMDVMSASGQFIGSMPWSSPEQAAGWHDRVDVRTDVYSLGVLLYQLLTGRFPYPVAGPLRDVLDNIQNAAPARPSSIRRSISDELDTIVLKALAKERERRYQSAGELARDIGHFLAGEPIEAKRDSGWYMIRKTLGRYRARVAVAAAFVLLLAGWGVTMSLMYGYAKSAEQDARTAEMVAQTGEASARRFLDRVLTAIDPTVARGRDTTLVREIFEEVAARVDVELKDQPVLKAAVRDAIGRGYMSIGEYDESEPFLRTALETRVQLLGEDHPDVAGSQQHLAELLKERGEYAEAETLYRTALDNRRRLLGREHPDIAETLNDLGQLHYTRREFDLAEPLLRDALAMRQRLLGPEHPDVASSLANLGSLLRDRGGPDALQEAKELLREALAMRERLLMGDHPHMAVSQNKLGLLLRQEGDYAGAEELLREALAMRLRLLAPDHEHIAVSQHNLALILMETERYDEAREHFEAAVEVWRRSPGDRNDLAAGLKGLSALHRQTGEFAVAEMYCREALAIRTRSDSPKKLGAAEMWVELGRIRLAAGDPHEAETLLRQALRVYQGVVPDTWLTAEVESTLGECLAARGAFDEAESLLAHAYDVIAADRGRESRLTRQAEERLERMREARAAANGTGGLDE